MSVNEKMYCSDDEYKPKNIEKREDKDNRKHSILIRKKVLKINPINLILDKLLKDNPTRNAKSLFDIAGTYDELCHHLGMLVV